MSLKIGLTYDLRKDYLEQGYPLEQIAEFDRKIRSTSLKAAIKSLGYQTDRVGNCRQLCSQAHPRRPLDLVFNIAEGLAGRSREAQVPSILETFGIPYTFSTRSQAPLPSTKISRSASSAISEYPLPNSNWWNISTSLNILLWNIPSLPNRSAKGQAKVSTITRASRTRPVSASLHPIAS